MGLVDNMKKEINKSGGSKGKILFIKAESKRRIRFLAEFENGIELLFHDSFAKGINCVCAKEIGEKHCKYCDDEDLRHRKQYAWPVYDYDSNEVKILLYAVNNCTPIPALISIYEAYSTIKDRDYVLERKGKQQSTSYSVIPMDKSKFKTKIKVPSEAAIIKMIGKAFDPNAEVDDDDDNEVMDYTTMTPKELYKLCEERDIEAEPKMKAKYYIDLLEEDDESDDWDDDDEEMDDDDDDEAW